MAELSRNGLSSSTLDRHGIRVLMGSEIEDLEAPDVKSLATGAASDQAEVDEVGTNGLALSRRKWPKPSTHTAPRAAGPIISYDTITVSREKFIQVMVKAVVGIAEKATDAHQRADDLPLFHDSMNLLDFDDLDLGDIPIDIGGDSDADSDADLDADADATNVSVRPRARRISSARRSARAWLPEDRRRLRSMKRKGWDEERMASALGRTRGAVSQQWRKQRQAE